MSSLVKIDNSTLFVSEPPPVHFGNADNESNNAAWTNKNWLKSRFHFSFAEYMDPSRSNFGVLRVMNDDLVQPARGFGTHPHRDMEIVTFVVRGSLTHKDSMGTQETLGRGSIQFMTAGSGIRHSEHNLSPDEDLRFIQMWLTPRQRGLQPNYGSLVGGPQVDEARRGKWSHLVSDTESAASTPVKINQDANMHVAQIGGKDSLTMDIDPGRMAYLLCIEGTLDVTNEADGREEALTQHDACQVIQPGRLLITTSSEEALVLLVEMRQ